jgi:hypothetical protein
MKFNYGNETFDTPLRQEIDGIYDANGKKFLDGYSLDEEIERLIIRAINLVYKKKRFWFF